MTPHDRELLAAADDATLLRWFCLFNDCQWVGDFDEPVGDDMYESGRRGQIVAAIIHTVGLYDCLRVWNCEYIDEPISVERFDRWYYRSRAA